MVKSTQHVDAEVSGLPGQCSFASVSAALAWVLLWDPPTKGRVIALLGHTGLLGKSK